MAIPHDRPSRARRPLCLPALCELLPLPGFVRLDDADITGIAAHLGLTEDAFIQRFTRLRPQRDGLALIDKPNGECVFLDGRDCRVQPVKPQQCRGFPNAWNFPGWREVCEAVPVAS